MVPIETIVFDSEFDFIHEICGFISKVAKESIQNSGVFRFVLTGGNTIKKIYESLVLEDIDWNDCEFFLGDERYVDKASEELNYNLAYHSFFSKISYDPKKVFKCNTDLDLENSALDYEKQISKTPIFDLVLFGLGDDGHIASLFPGRQSDMEMIGNSVAIVKNAPKKPPNRITLTLNRLNDTKHQLIFTHLNGKEQIVNSIIEETVGYPIADLNPKESLRLLYLK
ncbi:6-phosphogluconolactonase [Leptospira levettii]|uniref:6-phosphogluconolactonase n=1 Tax=Leptospira levettii TaxID=2023178 RepID=UPI0010839F06|nr:6-phosphogluconolactonase [Leptospira levettii]MCW7509279.1 6-phosphogluconolactonase [Leptospira levettii]MCW7520368.1 6-phosphogluconolactonase [Leptospira levettii]TGM35480.1 6-phosphogluconolactonase [Leptospira levettii]TGM65618.1 6-phosphogluconolactonase [Leptospira levettii]